MNRQKLCSRSSLAAIVLALASTSAWPREMADLFDLGLEELGKIKVSVASSKPELIRETPAIVSRYTRIDLEKMGITSLKELFNFVPGVIAQDSLVGMTVAQIRGIDETFNQKVLFLLDGIPYHQPSHSFIPMEGVPWESISHVEVIRGPGTVFHGTQASGGVFNVITRKDTDTNTASIRVGKNNLLEGSGYFGYQINADSAFSLAAEFRDEDDYNTIYEEVFPDVGLVTDEVARSLDKKSAIARYTNNNFLLQLQTFSDTTKGINDAYTDLETLQPFILDGDGQLIHMENTWFTDNFRTTIFADHNQYTFDLRINNLFAPGVGALVAKEDGGDDYRTRYGANLTYNINDSFTLELGMEQEKRAFGMYNLHLQSEPNNILVTLIDKGSTDEASAYSQLEYSHQNWRVMIGGRYTDNEKSGDKVTPRAALVYTIDDNQSIKALYSTGFNSPNPTQADIYLPGNVIGNNKLSAETVKAFDLAYSYSKENILFVANLYSYEAQDFIVRRFSPTLDAVTFFNEGKYRRQGAEIDFQMANDGNRLFANLAYQHQGNDLDINDQDAFRVPKLTMSIGAAMDLDDTHSIGGQLSYIGERQNLDSFTVVNVNYTARFENFEAFAVVRNLFNEDIRNPNNSTQNSPLVAKGEEGIHWQLGVRFHF